MIRAVANVLRGEGLASAMRRAAERIDESVSSRFSGSAELVNFSATRVAARTGGVAIQLLARLRAERALREVRLTERLGDLHAAKAVHLEGTAHAPLAELLALRVPLVVSVHDFTLWDEPLAPRFLETAKAAIFPSQFLLDRYRERFTFQGEVIEPAVPGAPVAIDGVRSGIAFAGSVKPHKGGHLLPELARALRTELHVFGGGDVELLLPLRRMRNAVVHGYYRAGTLPSLLARHRIGLVVLPSIVPESYSLTLSEAWLAGASVAAFDLGAQAERIRREGGGWLAPLDSGVAGLVQIVEGWNGNEPVPHVTATPDAAARAHVALYRRLGLL